MQLKNSSIYSFLSFLLALFGNFSRSQVQTPMDWSAAFSSVKMWRVKNCNCGIAHVRGVSLSDSSTGAEALCNSGSMSCGMWGVIPLQHWGFRWLAPVTQNDVAG